MSACSGIFEYRTEGNSDRLAAETDQAHGHKWSSFDVFVFFRKNAYIGQEGMFHHFAMLRT
jgi:hypothetical protein